MHKSHNDRLITTMYKKSRHSLFLMYNVVVFSFKVFPFYVYKPRIVRVCILPALVDLGLCQHTCPSLYVLPARARTWCAWHNGAHELYIQSPTSCISRRVREDINHYSSEQLHQRSCQLFRFTLRCDNHKNRPRNH